MSEDPNSNAAEGVAKMDLSDTPETKTADPTFEDDEDQEDSHPK